MAHSSASLEPGIVLDATHLLGFGVKSAEPAAQAEPGTVVINYRCWSLLELRENRRILMHRQNWYGKYPWAAEKLPSGLYVFRLPIPNANRKTFDEQKDLLVPGEESAPIVLAATALLSLSLSGYVDPLKNGWTRCKEQTSDDYGVALVWRDGRLSVDINWDDDRHSNLWLASARRTS